MEQPSPSSTPERQCLPETGLPGQTDELLRRLDDEVRKPDINPAKLADENYRLGIAVLQGKRDLVEWMMDIQRKHSRR